MDDIKKQREAIKRLELAMGRRRPVGRWTAVCVILAFWTAVGFVAVHFIRKWW